MIDALIAGKVSTAPSQRLGNNNNPFVTLRVNAATREGEIINIGVIAFDEKIRSRLMALNVGDSVSISGSITPKVWKQKDGLVKANLDMIASAVLTPYHTSTPQKTDT